MQMLLRAARLGLAIAATAAMPIQAQEQYSAMLKLRAGTVSGPVTSVSLGRRTEGLGVEIARKTGKGQLFAEFTYTLFNGYRRDVSQYGPAWYAGDTGQDPLHPTAPSQTTVFSDKNGPKTYDLYTETGNSIFGEMLEYQGFGLRLGYRAPITWLQGWDWQAGISLDRRETRHEVIMTLVPGFTYVDPTTGQSSFKQIAPTTGSKLDVNYYEGQRFTQTTQNLQMGAFVGVSHAFNNIFRTEFNARYDTFKAPHYVPFTYSGKVPTTTHSTKGGLVVEVGIGITL